MMYRVYSKTHPEGVARDGEIDPTFLGVMTPAIIDCIEHSGVYRGACPCCDKPIVVRMAGERSTLTAGDEHFLLHGPHP